MDVGSWLRGLGLEEYEAAFRENKIDEAVLPNLTVEDLKEVGVGFVGHRRKLLDAIAALRAEASAPTPVSDQPLLADKAAKDTAERRQVTVMFSDLVGSTALSARMDPEDLREVISAYQRRVADTVGRFGGFLAKFMGDGVLIYFGYPEAHEDDAESAVRAGLAVVEEVAHLPIPLAGPRLEVRIGIASGLVVVGDLLGSGAAQEQAVVGETPNLAARLQALAEPNAVIIADPTRRLVGALFEVKDLGAQELKGFAVEQRAWRVLGESGVESRFAAFRGAETPLVGRAEELDLLVRRWQQAKAGEGRVVLLSGEPGIGKSRLTEALIQRIAGEAPARLRYFCSPHHQESALHPVVAQIARAAGFTRDDLPEEKLRKLTALLGGTGAEDLPLLAELLSLPQLPSSPLLELSPQQRKELTFSALQRQLESLAFTRPVLMVFEDVHWIDPTTRELLDRTIALTERMPVLLIATFRPEFQPPWVGQPHVTMLALPRLGRREGAALVRELRANTATLPADIIDEIVERTDGVPLFIEEVTKVVLEAAASDDAARSTLASIPGARFTVPPTLQASLMARLDRLGAAAREVAQVGAAIGRDFSHELLLAASPHGAAETEAALNRLVAARLVFQRGVAPTADYTFKHALVQDTAYGSLLRGPRQALHARIAAAMLVREAETTERAPEIIAYHLAEAGEPDRAASWWLEAGQRAARRSANVEAMAHLCRGLSGLKQLPETPERCRSELELQLALGPAVFSLKGFGAPQARAAYERARTLAADLSDDRARFAAVWGCWLSGQDTTDTAADEVASLSEELSRIAEGLGDPALRLQAHHSAWATMMSQGRLDALREHVQQGLLLYDSDQHRRHALVYGGHDPAVCGHGQGAVALWFLGYADQAVQSARAGIDLAATLSHPPSLGHALWWAALVHYLRRDVAMALGCSERLIALGDEHSLQLYQAVGRIIHGWALAASGRVEEGLPELRQAIAAYGMAAKIMFGLYTTMLAETELGAGSPAEALRQLEAAERRASVGEPFWRAEVLRQKAELLAVQDAAAAELLLEESLDVARQHQAKSLELRAAASLGRLRQRKGRADEARAVLAPVVGWFTEGFDTPDLKQAKALLDELAPASRQRC